MIRVSGSSCRAFVFPGELPMAYAYYADVGRLLNYLPHIWLVRAYGSDRFRLLYSTTEMGAYQIRIFADVQTTLEEGWVIRVRPLEGMPPVKTEAGVSSAVAQGYFYSDSIFQDNGDETRIEYQLRLQANLPTPLGLRFMPGMMVERIAKSITHMRIREIVDGFVQNSADAFPHWLAEIENHASPSLRQGEAGHPPV